MLSVSIVICTDGRAASLQNTLRSLQQLNYLEFEVCVVHGPTVDGTKELLASWPDPIKIAANPEQNLAKSRNLGIALAAGEIVAFLDDDSIPEPEWLDQIVAAYTDESVGGAGGFVHDHTGVDYQYRFGTTDRLGRADLSWTRPAPELNFPYSFSFPHLLGANSSFRRAALMSVRGFDEEYEYYLDETDLGCRLVDDAWRIVQIEGAHVHHKFLPSALRNEARVLRSWYSVFKNKIYYSLMNGRGHQSPAVALKDAFGFIDDFRAGMERAIADGLLEGSDRERFEQEAARAWEDGLKRGMSETRRLLPPAVVKATPPSFCRFLPAQPRKPRLAFCLLTQEYPPRYVGGVGRYIHQLARGIAELGHQVHVLTRGEGRDRVDLEDGVWVHRIVPKPDSGTPPMAGPDPIPEGIWQYSSTMLAEVTRIAERRKIAGVYAPIWDCEGVAILRDGRFPLVVGLQTMLRSWIDSHPHRLEDRAYVASFINPMLRLETELLQQAPALHALSEAIENELERAYSVRLKDRSTVIPLGLDDFAALPAEPPKSAAGIDMRVLFVGRLEERKGIDVLLQIAPELLARYPNVQLEIVGNDQIAGADGRTYRAAFEARAVPDGVRRRVVFHGEVSEARLRGFYRVCDIFVAPSRFESFGLILVEAMMFGKPVIGCRAGGMTEVAAEGVTGLLAEPGDASSLEACLTRLIDDADLRTRMGAAGRRRYETNFTTRRMAEAVVDLMLSVRSPASHRDNLAVAGARA